jgi:hypothetical protein
MKRPRRLSLVPAEWHQLQYNIYNWLNNLVAYNGIGNVGTNNEALTTSLANVLTATH